MRGGVVHACSVVMYKVLLCLPRPDDGGGIRRDWKRLITQLTLGLGKQSKVADELVCLTDDRCRNTKQGIMFFSMSASHLFS